MPLIPLVAVLLLVLALILAMPLLLVLRYRAGTVRRLGRRWVATLNLVMIVLSAGLFLYVAAITSFWIPDAFRYSLFGLMGGCLLGLLGLALSRWEETPQALHYTPNRWLILIITLAVTARLLYGVWRIWHGWHASGSAYVVAGGGGCSRFPGTRSHRAWLLRHLLSRRPVAT